MEENWATGEFNMYAFVTNEPIGWIDILGRDKWNGGVDPISGTKRPPGNGGGNPNTPLPRLPNTQSPDIAPEQPPTTRTGAIAGAIGELIALADDVGTILSGRDASKACDYLMEKVASQTSKACCYCCFMYGFTQRGSGVLRSKYTFIKAELKPGKCHPELVKKMVNSWAWEGKHNSLPAESDTLHYTTGWETRCIDEKSSESENASDS